MKDCLKAIEMAITAITNKRTTMGKQQLPVVLPSGYSLVGSGIASDAPTPAAVTLMRAVIVEALIPHPSVPCIPVSRTGYSLPRDPFNREAIFTTSEGVPYLVMKLDRLAHLCMTMCL